MKVLTGKLRKSYNVLDRSPYIANFLGFCLFIPLRIFNSEWTPNPEVSFAFDFACLLCQILILFDWIKLDEIKLPFKAKNPENYERRSIKQYF